MLRSLVGSEMCIRDSPYTNQTVAVIDPLWNKSFAIQLDKAIIPYGVNTCLLYTSDAADDLLCVDLGGRRIIKKKIKQTH